MADTEKTVRLRQQENKDDYGAASKIEKGEIVDIHVGKATASQITINLITGGLGAGIFSLPWSTAGASILPATAIIAAVLIVNAGTIMLIVHAAERTRTFDLGALLGHLPGQSGHIAKWACNTFIWLSMFMCLVGYFIVVADAAVPFTKGVTVLPEHHRSIVVCLTALLIIPLCFCDLSKLSWSSSLAVLVNIYIFCLLCGLYWFQGSPSPDVCYLGFSRGSIAMVSAMMQAVIIQMCVLPMYKDLEDRSPQKFAKIVTVAFSSLFFIFTGFAVVAYLAFGPGVHGNILLDLPHTTWGNLARLGAALSVVVVYPIVMMPMTAPLENARWRNRDFGRSSWIPGFKVAIVILTMNCSLWITDLGFMNVINGAMSVGIFVALGPALVGFFVSDDRSSIAWQCTMGALLLFGILMSVLGLLFTDNYASILKAHCMWGRT